MCAAQSSTAVHKLVVHRGARVIAIAADQGPHHLLALGYAGWGPGQLDTEIPANGWLHVAADEALVFGPALDEKWDRAMAKIGIDPRMLSDAAGHA